MAVPVNAAFVVFLGKRKKYVPVITMRIRLFNQSVTNPADSTWRTNINSLSNLRELIQAPSHVTFTVTHIHRIAFGLKSHIETALFSVNHHAFFLVCPNC